MSMSASRYGVLLGNIGARIAALVSLTLATLLVARNGGPAAVGVYALLRVLPSLLGVVYLSRRSSAFYMRTIGFFKRGLAGS